jgi:hypothetical protein
MAEDSETSIKIYLREIMQTPLLTAQQEIELAANSPTDPPNLLGNHSKIPYCKGLPEEEK